MEVAYYAIIASNLLKISENSTQTIINEKKSNQKKTKQTMKHK